MSGFRPVALLKKAPRCFPWILRKLYEHLHKNTSGRLFLKPTAYPQEYYLNSLALIIWTLINVNTDKYHVESLTFHCPKNLLQVNNKKKRKTFIKLALVPVLLTLNRYLHTDNKSSCSKLIMLTWWKCQLMSFSDMYLGYCQTSIVKLFSFFAKVVNGITDAWHSPKYTCLWWNLNTLSGSYV